MDGYINTTSVVLYLVLPVRENCIVEESKRDDCLDWLTQKYGMGRIYFLILFGGL